MCKQSNNRDTSSTIYLKINLRGSVLVYFCIFDFIYLTFYGYGRLLLVFAFE